MRFKVQNPTHNEKRLQCACGAWNWKIQMEYYITAPLYVCAECGAMITSSGVEDMIRKEHEETK